MTKPPVVTERAGAAGVIRFVRPESKNPLSVETLDALESALASLAAGSPERIVITGSGDTFASGANIREVAALDPEAAGEFGRRGQELMLRIKDFPVPVIAAIDGFCFGGALDLAVACRYRIASERSKFCHPGPKLGIITGWGGTQLLPRLIGDKRALEMLLTAKIVDAPEALRIGLIDLVDEDPVGAALGFEGGSG
ncbi:MAG TPA: enoyl-CoA hydratase/isomerase family protein [Aridibacter sp.]|nr:enoyl-CoA hydratase/isomerase family protein [Aridibacter sp.]